MLDLAHPTARTCHGGNPAPTSTDPRRGPDPSVLAVWGSAGLRHPGGSRCCSTRTVAAAHSMCTTNSGGDVVQVRGPRNHFRSSMRSATASSPAESVSPRSWRWPRTSTGPGVSGRCCMVAEPGAQWLSRTTWQIDIPTASPSGPRTSRASWISTHCWASREGTLVLLLRPEALLNAVEDRCAPLAGGLAAHRAVRRQDTHHRAGGRFDRSVPGGVPTFRRHPGCAGRGLDPRAGRSRRHPDHHQLLRRCLRKLRGANTGRRSDHLPGFGAQRAATGSLGCDADLRITLLHRGLVLDL